MKLEASKKENEESRARAVHDSLMFSVLSRAATASRRGTSDVKRWHKTAASPSSSMKCAKDCRTRANQLYNDRARFYLLTTSGSRPIGLR